MSDPATKDVYISFYEDDAPEVIQWIKEDLLPKFEVAGATYCTPSDFKIGVSKISNHSLLIENSRYTLIIITPDFLENAWTKFDSSLIRTLSIEDHPNRLLPAKFIECDLPKSIDYLAVADLTNRTTRSEIVYQIITQILDGKFSAKPLTDIPHAEFFASGMINDPRYFFGRRTEIRRICGLLSRQPLQHSMINGPRFSGKSSLLKHIVHIGNSHNSLRPDQKKSCSNTITNYDWVYVDFYSGRVKSPNQLLSFILEELELSYSNPINIDSFEKIIASQLSGHLIILLDEIGLALQKYKDLDDGGFWGNLRSLATTSSIAGRLGFIVSSTGRSRDLPTTIGRGSPFFGIFNYTVELKPFSHEELNELITTSPRPFSEENISWIIEQSAGWPILAQILCNECLHAIEDAVPDDIWRKEALEQIKPLIEKMLLYR